VLRHHRQPANLRCSRARDPQPARRRVSALRPHLKQSSHRLRRTRPRRPRHHQPRRLRKSTTVEPAKNESLDVVAILFRSCGVLCIGDAGPGAKHSRYRICVLQCWFRGAPNSRHPGQCTCLGEVRGEEISVRAISRDCAQAADPGPRPSRRCSRVRVGSPRRSDAAIAPTGRMVSASQAISGAARFRAQLTQDPFCAISDIPPRKPAERCRTFRHPPANLHCFSCLSEQCVKMIKGPLNSGVHKIPEPSKAQTGLAENLIKMAQDAPSSILEYLHLGPYC
jgi:hypothetical protein